MPRESNSAPAAGPLAEAVALARANESFLAQLNEMLRRAEANVLAADPTCRACGRCCHFDEREHRLYVSTGELALLAADPPPACPPGRCPYQQGALCTARPRRALGCRTFYCDRSVQDHSNAIYESAHQAIRRLHDQHGIPYHYVELTAALPNTFPPLSQAR